MPQEDDPAAPRGHVLRSESHRRREGARAAKVPLSRLLRPAVSWKQFFRDLLGEIEEDHLTNGAAALAYFLMLSIFPAAIFLLSLLPYLPVPDLERAILDLLRQALPPQAADLFTTTVKDVLSERRGGLLSFGFLATLWAASTGLTAIMQQLNITYDVKETRPFWKVRGIALLLVVAFGVLVIGAFALVVFGGVLQARIADILGWSRALLALFAVFRWAVILCLLLLGLALMYSCGPGVEQDFRLISPGSILGTVVLVLSALGFRLYVEAFGAYEATYGSLGAVIILLLWLYVAGFAILLGSEVNALLEHYAGVGKQKGDKTMPRE